jgi:hypothetical protein
VHPLLILLPIVKLILKIAEPAVTLRVFVDDWLVLMAQYHPLPDVELPAFEFCGLEQEERLLDVLLHDFVLEFVLGRERSRVYCGELEGVGQEEDSRSL